MKYSRPHYEGHQEIKRKGGRKKQLRTRFDQENEPAAKRKRIDARGTSGESRTIRAGSGRISCIPDKESVAEAERDKNGIISCCSRALNV